MLNGQPADEDYLAEEVRLAKNRIHMSEIQLVLARAATNRGSLEQARQVLLDAKVSGRGLYFERCADELLGELV